VKIHLQLIALAVGSALALTACGVPAAEPAAEPTATSTEATKEAGILGARICFTNKSSLPISARPSDRLRSSYADHAVGKAGDLQYSDELCFAGYKSYDVREFYPEDGGNVTNVRDTAVLLNIDGKESAMLFYANNMWGDAPYVRWTTAINDGRNEWVQTNFLQGPVGMTRVFIHAGRSFIATRNEDSEFYKEFTIEIMR
jgi:hypothetical protein